MHDTSVRQGFPLPSMGDRDKTRPRWHAGWAGLVVNGLNTIPIGELDGGRIAHAIWGRSSASRISIVLILVLGLAGIVDSLSLYWILLVITLQRGPVAQQEEVSEPDGVVLGIALLALPLLTLIPYPVDVTSSGF
jgi:membrane-associated protease RseP (regulator of RpoE activity)